MLKKLLCILIFGVNACALTADDLIKLGKCLGNEPLTPFSFVEECYDLLAAEENPRNVEYLYRLFDIAQRSESEVVLNYLNHFKSILQTERRDSHRPL